MIPKILEDVGSFLNEVDIPVCTRHSDGRLNSAEDETTIIRILQDEYDEENIIEGVVRHWWDVKIFGYPVNIKSSAFKTADNFSAKGAVLYSVTNITEEEITKINSFPDFEGELRKSKGEDNNRDYYCLVLNKTTNEVLMQGLKTLTKLTPNGNNLLFQINWSKNKEIIERSDKEGYEFLIGAYKESVSKKVGIHEGYETL
jgi:hypothetical protein